MYGSSFLRSSLPPAPTLAHRCYDSAVPSRQVEMATSSNPNYTLVSTYDFIQGPCSSNRHGGETDVHASSYQPTSTTTTTFMAMSEQQYTQDVGQEIMDRQYARSAPHSGRQQPSLRSQPSYSRNPVPPDFTGEELSAVLELVKDSCYTVVDSSFSCQSRETCKDCRR
uniref:Uncharacterized protein n=1 Tax=Hyaloperonospora arabidopsidis (strain Emoy2) TaxID=559515 RepID=M4B9J8_HYAAE